MLESGHPLARNGLDAHEIEFGGVERLRPSRIGEESIAAECELGHMTFDRLLFPLLLAIRELDVAGEAFFGSIAMDNVGRDRRIGCSRVRVVRDRPMVGMQIK